MKKKQHLFFAVLCTTAVLAAGAAAFSTVEKARTDYGFDDGAALAFSHLEAGRAEVEFMGVKSAFELPDPQETAQAARLAALALPPSARLCGQLALYFLPER